MAKDMVHLKEGNTHSLLDYAYSKEIIKDLPRIISIYEKLIPVLESYQKYTGAAHVLESVRDSRALLKMQLDYYKKIYKSKGLINE